MKSMPEIHLRAVAFADDGMWVVQGIEYDIAAHAADLSQLPDAFMKAVVENICISIHLGREPLDGIKPAPDKYKEMFESAGAVLSSVHPALPPDNLPAPQLAIRLAAAA
jgi:hypothetical protein